MIVVNRQLFLGLVSLTFVMWLRTFFCMPKHAIPWPLTDKFEFSWRDWKNTKQARESGSITSCKSDDRFLCTRWVDIKANLLTKNFIFMNLWYIGKDTILCPRVASESSFTC